MSDDDAAAMLAQLPELVRRDPDAELKPGEVQVPTLPLPPPRDRDELDRLLLTVACTPVGDAALIEDTIAAFDEPGTIADLAHQVMFELPTADLGRHLTLLSLVGSMRHESSTEPLERFVWLEDGEVYGTTHADPTPRHNESAGSVFPYSGVLQARAAEMLVWVTGGSYLDGVRRILEGHRSATVRVAAIDAYLFARDDSDDARTELRRMVRVEDRWAVGLPRRMDHEEAAGFDEVLARHLAEYDAPPAPERAAGYEEDR